MVVTFWVMFIGEQNPWSGIKSAPIEKAQVLGQSSLEASVGQSYQLLYSVKLDPGYGWQNSLVKSLVLLRGTFGDEPLVFVVSYQVHSPSQLDSFLDCMHPL